MILCRKKKVEERKWRGGKLLKQQQHHHHHHHGMLNMKRKEGDENELKRKYKNDCKMHKTNCYFKQRQLGVNFHAF